MSEPGDILPRTGAIKAAPNPFYEAYSAETVWIDESRVPYAELYGWRRNGVVDGRLVQVMRGPL